MVTALSDLSKDRPQYILKARIIELQTSFRLRQFFAGTLRKWRLIFLPRYFSLAKNSAAIGETYEWKSGLRLDVSSADGSFLKIFINTKC